MTAHIEQCVKMGIKSSNILALQGPFSLELNKAIFNQYHIDVVVTKDSGKTGGVPEKNSGCNGDGNRHCGNSEGRDRVSCDMFNYR